MKEKIKNLISSILFLDESSHIKTHILSSNPYPSGHERDAMLHGPSFFSSLWSSEIIDIDLSFFDNGDNDPFSLCDVDRYLDLYKNGSSFPAIIINVYPSGLITVEDGKHRLRAAQKAGCNSIKAYIGIIKN